jgi:hypothetical protein
VRHSILLRYRPSRCLSAGFFYCATALRAA